MGRLMIVCSTSGCGLERKLAECLEGLTVGLTLSEAFVLGEVDFFFDLEETRVASLVVFAEFEQAGVEKDTQRGRDGPIRNFVA